MRNDLSGKELREWARKTMENVWDSDILKETQEGWRNNTANAIIKACEHIERDGVDEERVWLLGGFVEYYVVLIEVVRKLAEKSWLVDNDTCWEIHDEFMTRSHTDQWEKTLDKCIKYKIDTTRAYATTIANAMLRRRRLYNKGLRNVRLLEDGLTLELELEEGELVDIKADSVQTSSAEPLQDPIYIEANNDYDGPCYIFNEGIDAPTKKVTMDLRELSDECFEKGIEQDWQTDSDEMAKAIFEYADETDDAGGDIIDDGKEETYEIAPRSPYKYRVNEFIDRFKRQVISMGGSLEDVKETRDQEVIKLTYGALEVKRNLRDLKDDKEWAEDYASNWCWEWFAENDLLNEEKNSKFFDIYCRIEAFLDNEDGDFLFIDKGEDKGREMVHLCDIFHQVCARICDQQTNHSKVVKIDNLPLVYALAKNTVGTDGWKEYVKRLNGTPTRYNIVTEYCLYVAALVLGLKPDNQTYEPWELGMRIGWNCVRYDESDGTSESD